jgi:hypothetical protein
MYRTRAICLSQYIDQLDSKNHASGRGKIESCDYTLDVPIKSALIFWLVKHIKDIQVV